MNPPITTDTSDGNGDEHASTTASRRPGATLARTIASAVSGLVAVSDFAAATILGFVWLSYNAACDSDGGCGQDRPGLFWGFVALLYLAGVLAAIGAWQVWRTDKPTRQAMALVASGVVITVVFLGALFVAWANTG